MGDVEFTATLTIIAVKWRQAMTIKAICQGGRGQGVGIWTSKLDGGCDWKRRKDRISLAHSARRVHT